MTGVLSIPVLDQNSTPFKLTLRHPSVTGHYRRGYLDPYYHHVPTLARRTLDQYPQFQTLSSRCLGRLDRHYRLLQCRGNVGMIHVILFGRCQNINWVDWSNITVTPARCNFILRDKRVDRHETEDSQ